MVIDCPHIKAVFPAAGYAFYNDQPGRLQWDCHHGATFIMWVTGLTMTAIPQEPGEAAVTVEISLSPREVFIAAAEKFAATQGLDLTVFSTPPREWSEPATLTAVHAPEAKLFIFSEEAVVAARPAGPPLHYELTVIGAFKTRLVPCRETDLVIYLEKPAAARLLSFFLAGVRG